MSPPKEVKPKKKYTPRFFWKKRNQQLMDFNEPTEAEARSCVYEEEEVEEDYDDDEDY